MSQYDEFDEERPFTEEELITYKQLLLSKKEELLNRMRQRGKDEALHQEVGPGDAGDVAAGHSRQILQARLAERDTKLLREVNHALSKFEDQTYGYCEGTDEPIGRPRLKIRPWTRYSVAYKESVEQRRRERRLVQEY